MVDDRKDYGLPECSMARHYIKEIVDIVDNIEDEVFLRRVYISLREYAKDKDLE